MNFLEERNYTYLLMCTNCFRRAPALCRAFTDAGLCARFVEGGIADVASGGLLWNMAAKVSTNPMFVLINDQINGPEAAHNFNIAWQKIANADYPRVHLDAVGYILAYMTLGLNAEDYIIF